MTAPLLAVEGVTKRFSSGSFLARRHLVAVNEVSFELPSDRPEIFAVVGESGSGKSTLARLILREEVPSAGRLRFEGTDLATLRGRTAHEAFMARVQPVFQNPFETFNPLTHVDRYLFSTARRFRGAEGSTQAAALADEALNEVGLSLAEVKGRFPHELSGGQLQRVAVARALIPRPKLIVADEPVSMVDASLRMSIVNLFRRLRDELRVSIVYITHDLATTYYMSDRVIIMQRGQVVESGNAREVLDAPQHPYAQALKKAVLPPTPDGASAFRVRLAAVGASAGRAPAR